MGDGGILPITANGQSENEKIMLEKGRVISYNVFGRDWIFYVKILTNLIVYYGEFAAKYSIYYSGGFLHGS